MQRPKILVLGSNGMAGKEFVKQFKSEDHEILSLARRNADIELDCTQYRHVVEALDQYQPDIIINCCAIVNMNMCEDNPYSTFKINVGLVEVLSAWCSANKRKFVHISTDHFYDYGDAQPHTETDPLVTVNNYSRQKLSSEHVALFDSNSLILRTSITGIKDLCQPKTFFDWAYAVCKNNENATLFTDAYTSTIDIRSFVQYTISLIKLDAYGIYNVASSEVYSKADFTIELARQLGRSTEKFNYGQVSNLKVKRANCLGLSVEKLGSVLPNALPDLNKVVNNLLNMVGEI